jgi:hypothetical protein
MKSPNARVSIATVSRTINGIPTVTPQLSRRVWKVIEELGYYPNTQARALVSGRSRIFGLIVSENTNPFFPEIVQGFEDIAVQHSYEVLLTSTVHDAKRRTTSTQASSCSVCTTETSPVLAFASTTSFVSWRWFTCCMTSEFASPANSIRAMQLFSGSPVMSIHFVSPPVAATTPMRTASGACRAQGREPASPAGRCRIADREFRSPHRMARRYRRRARNSSLYWC